MSDEERGKSWWQTLPGILTSVTAIITAVAGLLVAINQTGWFAHAASTDHVIAPRVESSASGAQQAGTASGGAQASLSHGATSIILPQLREYRLGELVFTLLGASVSRRNTEANTLAIKVRLVNNQSYPTNFWNQQFRLLIDDIPQAPSGDLNDLVDGNSAKEGEVTFVIPQTTSAVKLRIQVSDEKTDIPLGFVRS